MVTNLPSTEQMAEASRFLVDNVVTHAEAQGFE